MTLDFTTQQIEALLNYLATRPWGEVQAIIAPLLQQVQEQQQQAQQAPQAQLHAVEG